MTIPDGHETISGRFGFLNSKDLKQKKIYEEIKRLQELPKEAKPYTLNYKDVNRQYALLGVGDIDEFSCSYTFGWSMLNGFINDSVIKHAIYLDIRNHLLSSV